MLFKGKLAELMVMVDPGLYRKCITYDSKGNTMLYVQMNKALYGLLQSAPLFYKKLRKDLEGYGFVINPYDPCVTNAMINVGHQMTVTWHVNDLKVSHKDPFEITKFATYLSSIYGKKLSVKRGKVHDYLGKDLAQQLKNTLEYILNVHLFSGQIVRLDPIILPCIYVEDSANLQILFFRK